MVEPYVVEFRPDARDQLRALDKQIAQRILDKLKWLSINFDEIAQQSLTHDFKGLFKLRIGDYRVAYTVSRQEHCITVHLIDHRRRVYKQR